MFAAAKLGMGGLVEPCSRCPVCRGPVTKPPRGGPRLYCGPRCRRQQEYAVRRLRRAERVFGDPADVAAFLEGAAAEAEAALSRMVLPG